MKKHFNLRFKVNEEVFNDIQDILKILKERGWKSKDEFNLQDVLCISLFKGLTPQFKQKFIEEQTPVDFLLQEALKEPSMRRKLSQFLKTNQKQKLQAKGNSK
ncbi:MAG: hypothetical protein OXB86_00970 [Bdellovibrionales bacterium]|nr:hypothetical protein [Bdellovibrionales bacterium]